MSSSGNGSVAEQWEFVVFGVMIASKVKSTVLCDVTPCSLAEIYQRFEETHCFNLQDRKESQARNQQAVREVFVSVKESCTE
jgi:hypothetical protein